MPRREINITPSCMSEIHAFSSEHAAQLIEKINFLVDDPIPDGKLKKKLKTKATLYRLRVGDHRVFYTFGESWVRILGIRARDKATYKGLDGYERDGGPTEHDEAEIDLDETLAAGYERPEFSLAEGYGQSELPRKITADWLQELGVPSSLFSPLTTCRTEDELLSAAVPSDVIERVLDKLFPRPLDEVEHQPSFVVQDTSDLVRYKQGDLIGFLLQLDDEQEQLVHWAIDGPTMIKGGAGTGKSTIALHRVKALLERKNGPRTVLFTTYTKALEKASRQLLEQLLTPEQMKRVRVASCDKIAREIAGLPNGFDLLRGTQGLDIVGHVRRAFEPPGESAFEKSLTSRALDRLSDRYLFEEFEWIIEGRALSTLEEYLEAPRPGRGFPFKKSLRKAVWALHGKWRDELESRSLESWTQMRMRALDAAQNGTSKLSFDAVVVDEAQDLTPTSLALMVEICATEKGVVFAADTKQLLYSRNYSWSSAHPRLQFKGRTAVLKRNYRSTAEIDRAAFGVLGAEDQASDGPSVSVHTGPLPVLLRNVELTDEAAWAARFIRQMARHLRIQIGGAAVLAPKNEIAERIADELNQAGLPAQYFRGRDLDLTATSVKVLTLHSAKGLEFPIVVMCGFDEGSYPVAENFGEEGVFDERMQQHRRLLYVGMTRAMRGLMVSVPKGCRDEALSGLGEPKWAVEKVG